MSKSSFWPPSAYLVGGAVRDELLGIVPHSKQNRDFVVPKWRDTVSSYMSEYMPDAMLLIEKHGKNSVSARVRTVQGEVLDLSFTANSIGLDLIYRDFTVNSFSRDAAGNVTAGRLVAFEHLESRTLATLGLPYCTLAADPARIIRAYRLQHQLSKAENREWSLDKGLASELASLDAVSLLSSLDKDRLVNEVVKLASIATANEFFCILSQMPSNLSEIMLSVVQSLKLRS